MFIHIGGRVLVSDRMVIGIFNLDTLSISTINDHHLPGPDSEYRTVVIDRNNDRLFSIVSPYTLIKRGLDDEDFFWRR